MRAEVVGLLTDPEQARKPFSYAFDLLDAIEGPDAVSELKLATAGEKRLWPETYFRQLWRQ
ncbi:hypothetical protein JCM18916_3439 [Cutibacterium acnes JCM 18916]|nr:hypothetical protein JCM18916_3439 [Cutibacterium acnes JCM 18916]